MDTLAVTTEKKMLSKEQAKEQCKISAANENIIRVNFYNADEISYIPGW